MNQTSRLSHVPSTVTVAEIHTYSVRCQWPVQLNNYSRLIRAHTSGTCDWLIWWYQADNMYSEFWPSAVYMLFWSSVHMQNHIETCSTVYVSWKWMLT